MKSSALRCKLAAFMKAIVQKAYGDVDVYSLAEVPSPVPAADEVLIKVRAASLHADVWHVMTGLPRVLRIMGSGLARPRQPIPGTDVSGVIVATGESVTRFKVGDEIFGETLRGGLQWMNGGAFAQYVACPVTALALKPTGVTFESAAAVPTSALIALNNLRDIGRLTAGQHVLINGAGGGVGSQAVQLARALGAEVTAVDSGQKQDLLHGLGANHVIDFEQVDFTKGNVRYDLIFDIPGNHPYKICKRVLKPSGVYVLVGHDRYDHKMKRGWLGLIPHMVGMMMRARFDRHLPRGITMPDRTESMELLRRFLEAGQLTPPWGGEEGPEKLT
jgi:NADPH:quinone reductase-like Zn-dependent oxidoreductase